MTKKSWIHLQNIDLILEKVTEVFDFPERADRSVYLDWFKKITIDYILDFLSFEDAKQRVKNLTHYWNSEAYLSKEKFDQSKEILIDYFKNFSSIETEEYTIINGKKIILSQEIIKEL
ncbi:hypothetical protein [Mycoplasma procyoni]|uniref:hypothetical protein n=1 Tax=Mycoplasma procyoni TaxID=568784 RepID=UPI00197BA025|nr:hypothetical protein [Mycoplasma procyoni]MBN3534958.1 hypothetical protein [Mycoplasma procyoni]